MDPITGAGILLTFGAILLTLLLEGSSPMSILLLPPLVLVFVGTFGAALAGLAVSDLKQLPTWFKMALVPAKAPDVGELIATLVKLAEKARKEGLLALDADAGAQDDPFLRRGLQLVVDGTDPDQLRDVLESEIDARKGRYKVAARFFADMGGYSPTIGIIGTVIGLIHVLENLSNPEELGALIAGAFVATLWGVLSANALWLPMGRKVNRCMELDLRAAQVLIEGLAEIVAGSTPRNVQQKLASLVGGEEQLESAA